MSTALTSAQAYRTSVAPMTYSSPPVATYSSPPAAYSVPTVASYSPPPVSTYNAHVGSYAPPPSLVAPPAQMPPQSLVAGIPDPRAVDAQKVRYLQSIDNQLSEAQSALQTERVQQKDYYLASIEQEKKQYAFQRDQEAAQKIAALEQHYQLQVFQLHDAARQHRVTLEEQSARLIEDYNQRKAHTALQNEQYALQQRAYEDQTRLQAQIGHLQQQQASNVRA